HFIDRVSDDVQKGRFDIRPDAPHAISPTAFLDSLARGTAYLNYFGLATPTSWSQSDFLNQSILQMLQNSRRPFFLYQFHQEGAVFSPILEALLTLEEGGACGAIVPTGYNYAYTTDQILNNVYMVLLNQNHPRIGDAFLTIQQSGFLRFPGNNQEIHRLRLVGDPSMPIPQF
ncbi:MAG TPA: C25 family cysteine peptidase, partial [Calditrichia bacterium]|nr:C25 family cysteine peptidase [Calditrichia bacterium]